MTDEMLVAQQQWLPQYGTAIAAARDRLVAGPLLPTREGYKGAAGLHTRTVGEMAAARQAANRQAGEADKAEERAAAQ